MIRVRLVFTGISGDAFSEVAVFVAVCVEHGQAVELPVALGRAFRLAHFINRSDSTSGVVLQLVRIACRRAPVALAFWAIMCFYQD